MAEYRQWLKTLSSRKGVLEETQLSGIRALHAQDLPSSKDESWRLTNLKRLEAIFKVHTRIDNQEINNSNASQLANKPKNGYQLNLNCLKENIDLIDLPNGLRTLTNQELKNHLNKRKASLEKNWLVAINNASVNEILGLKLETNDMHPLEIIMPLKAATLSFSKVIILLDKNTNLELLQVFIGSYNSAHSHLLEIHLEEGAELNHGIIALGESQSTLLSHLSIEQELNSKYSLTSVLHGWELSRMEPQVIQTSGNAETNLNGLQVSVKNEQQAMHSLVRFNGPEGQLNQLQKSLASENSHCIFNGTIEVPKVAQRTNAAQLSRNLLISERAKIDTKPELEIVADDVKCAHGATVSQLQEDELFYLRSRGIDTNEATSLLLKGYCEEIINHLPVEPERWEVLKKLLKSIKS